jgi:hypothetical protein
VSIALAILQNEIQDLGNELGISLVPDEKGHCAIQLDSGLIVTLTVSPESARYGLHCFLLEAPQVCSHAVLIEAMQESFLLSYQGCGALVYDKDEEGIVYTWNHACALHGREHTLPQEFSRFVARAERLRELLLAIRDEEYAGTVRRQPPAPGPHLVARG